MSSPGIKQANKNFEHWLERQLNGEVVTGDLKKKRKKMSDGPFPFLRATYWRWSETILQVCPDLQRAPPVLAVGDIHLDNYGTWRDAEGRLVWGVNDFDEAANMPYGLDLVRLAASALLKQKAWDAEDICAAIIEGYRRGLAEPRAFVLDEGRTWLLNRLAVSTEERQGFWDHMDNLKPAIPPPRYRAAIVKTMPEQKSKMKFAPRSAGLGSLGRARWVGIADWRGGRVVRECKVLTASAWTRVFAPKALKQQSGAISAGRYRSPDPWYHVANGLVVRRLSPNNRKIEFGSGNAGNLLDAKLLRAMGRELANVQHGAQDRRKAVEADLAKRKPDWLLNNATAAADFVTREFREWSK
jgi:hypothetical protein